MADQSYSDPRAAALALLNSGHSLTLNAGRFLGQVVVTDDTLTEKQIDWLIKLLEKAKLPPLANDKGE